VGSAASSFTPRSSLIDADPERRHEFLAENLSR
jgi:hypothetical protein